MEQYDDEERGLALKTGRQISELIQKKVGSVAERKSGGGSG